MNDKICIYLRKSRADIELEKTIGEFETLAKHRKTLLKFAQSRKFNIVDIKEELVSGEEIAFRPKMIELLDEVEANKYDGVLVMDIDRLGRGNLKDQGTILEAFKNSHTLIITPDKTYDMHNEQDEELTEFKAFFSRKELKMITKRMQGGRIRSVEDGNYIGTTAPYGYDIEYQGRNRTLKINEEEAEIVRLIFKMYIEGNGGKAITNYLNSLGVTTKLNNKFCSSSVLNIIKNPIYCGKITWKKREYKKSKVEGKKKDCRTRDKSEWIISQGKHDPIISEETFNSAKEILDEKYHIPYQLVNGPTNPLAGLIICKVCGSKMVMRPSRGIYRVMCVNKCGNASCRWDYFEGKLLDSLEEYLKKYKADIKAKPKKEIKLYEKQLKGLNSEFEELRKQKDKLYDLLERGIYTEEVFLTRSNNIDGRINTLNKEIELIQGFLDKENRKGNKEVVIILKNVIESYKLTDDIGNKNLLMKSILYKVEYYKEPKSKPSKFHIDIFPKLLS